ncbi:MAG: cysteine desulfurase [Proteobacteria bacterium]|nr:cysteine desulfurase [Pseudomonadota bacterium]
MKSLYLDYNATTPVDPAVYQVMAPYFVEHFGNSVSSLHEFGWKADQAVETARQQVAHLLGCRPQEIFFTSGATESNNWVIRGLMDHWRKTEPQFKPHVLSSPVEHSSVIQTLNWAQRAGLLDVTFVPVDSSGKVQVEEVKKNLRPETKLMSFMWVNNELGTFNPLQELGKLAHERQIYLHTDATQAIGKTKVDLSEFPVDLLSFSGHKIYGPKGVGILYRRSKNPSVQLEPLLYGGGHERGQRSGTVNVPAVVGMGAACEIVAQRWAQDVEKMMGLKKQLYADLKGHFPGLRLNGSQDLEASACNTLNLTFTQQQLPGQIPGLAVSRGSACHSGSTTSSQVLKAIGIPEREAQNTLRISMGRDQTWEDLSRVAPLLKACLR